ncbi:MAG: AAA family ATPase [Planctomycetes bacterium]|nr:AAA family ATPase [Planctomycetota bacterium]
MLRSLKLTNWKSFGVGEAARNEVKFGPLTVFVGPNGSGKSNALDAIRFLKGLAIGLPVFDALRGRQEGGRQTWPGIRGAENEAVRLGAHGLKIDATFVAVETPIGFSLHLDRGAELHAAEERIEYGGVSHALTNPRGADLLTEHPRTQSLLAEMHSQSLGAAHSHMEPASATAWQRLGQLLRDALFLDVAPSAARSPAPIKAPHIGESGENLAAMLRGLSDADQQALVAWLSELAAPQVRRLEFEEVKSVGDVYFLVVEQHGNAERRISARSLSDGTLRFLGILTALMTVPEGSIVVLEEPDAGLHPTRIHLLAELLESITAKRKIQVIATTHSPTLLANLSREAFANVVAFDRDRDTGWTVCSRVGDMEHKDIILDAPDRDHLIATGWLERAL